LHPTKANSEKGERTQITKLELLDDFMQKGCFIGNLIDLYGCHRDTFKKWLGPLEFEIYDEKTGRLIYDRLPPKMVKRIVAHIDIV